MPSKTHVRDEQLVECFVASFEKLSNMVAYKTDPVAQELAVSNPDQYGFKRWQPKRVGTGRAAPEAIYVQLPGRFPPLYERLALSWRWAEVDLQSHCLLANPPGPDLFRSMEQISMDPTLWKYLGEAGYLQFGRAPGG